MQDINTKAKYIRAFGVGAFGARPAWWPSASAVEASGYTGLVVLRTLVGSNGPCVYDITLAQARAIIAASTIPERLYYFNTTTDDTKVLIQGEWLNDHFLYSIVKAKMRLALARDPRTADGLKARLLLQHFMTPSSWSDFEACIDLYPDHVIEVSVYDCDYGDIPGRNAIVWECRKY
jgi:hypothetical protein